MFTVEGNADAQTNFRCVDSLLLVVLGTTGYPRSFSLSEGVDLPAGTRLAELLSGRAWS